MFLFQNQLCMNKPGFTNICYQKKNGLLHSNCSVLCIFIKNLSLVFSLNYAFPIPFTDCMIVHHISKIFIHFKICLMVPSFLDLLRQNSYIIQFIYLKWTVQGLLVCFPSCASIITINVRTFSLPPKETSHALVIISHSLHLSPAPSSH